MTIIIPTTAKKPVRWERIAFRWTQFEPAPRIGFALGAASGYFAAGHETCRQPHEVNAMSMQSAASPTIRLSPPKRGCLKHIPGDEGWPIVGKTLQVLADPKGHVEQNAAKYGLVYRTHLFGETSIVLLGPEANELVMFDQARM